MVNACNSYVRGLWSVTAIHRREYLVWATGLIYSYILCEICKNCLKAVHNDDITFVHIFCPLLFLLTLLSLVLLVTLYLFRHLKGWFWQRLTEHSKDMGHTIKQRTWKTKNDKANGFQHGISNANQRQQWEGGQWNGKRENGRADSRCDWAKTFFVRYKTVEYFISEDTVWELVMKQLRMCSNIFLTLIQMRISAYSEYIVCVHVGTPDVQWPPLTHFVPARCVVARLEPNIFRCYEMLFPCRLRLLD